VLSTLTTRRENL